MEVTLMDPRLYNAAMSGNVTDLIQLVVDENRPEILNHVTPQRNTALHIAAKRGHTDFVKELLLKKPCILLCLNSKRENALHAAATSGNYEVVKVLLESASRAMCSCASCVQSGLTEEVDLEKNLVERGYFWRAQNSKRNTALHIAVKEGYPDIVDLLLKKTENGIAYLVNAAGESPLFTAAEHGRLGILKQLLEVDPPMCGTDRRGRTPLHAALRRQHWDVARQLLVKRGDLAEQADESCSTPLHLATEGGQVEIVRIILENYPKACGAANGDEMCAIHIAARNGDENVVRELLRWNPDSIELLDGDGKTALHLAIECDHWDVACYLLKNTEVSFLINEPDKEGNTILHTTMFRLPNIRTNSRLPLKTNDEILGGMVRMWKEISSRTSAIRTKTMGEIAQEMLSTTSVLRKTTGESETVCEMLRMSLPMWRMSVNEENEKGQTALDIHDSHFGEFGGSPYREHLIHAGAVHGRKWRSDSEKKDASWPSETGEPSDKGEQVNSLRETLAIIAVLLATVTFTAAMTPPGGVNSETGYAVLADMVAFKVFVISDTLAMCLSMVVLSLLLLSLSLRSYASSGLLERIDMLLEWAFVAAMVAFMTAIHLLVGSKRLWSVVTVCVFGAYTVAGFCFRRSLRDKTTTVGNVFLKVLLDVE